MQMIERMARAIHAALASAEPIWEALDPGEQARYRDAATRSLAALRTPTEAMLAEGRRHDLPTDAANIWERMLFSALRG